jgi:hypothetical protein
MATSKVTLASLDQKLESFMDMMKEHIESDRVMFDKLISALDGNGKPGIKTRIEIAEKDIESLEDSRNKQVKAIWSTLVVVVGAILISFLRH